MIKGGLSGMDNKTPYFELHLQEFKKNLERLEYLQQEANVKILHTLKSFNEPMVLPLIGEQLLGMSISSLKELEFAKNAKVRHIHLYTPAFKADELSLMQEQVDTISFNSLSQWRRFSSSVTQASLGLRVNPKLHLPIPNYCNPNVAYSRLGVDYIAFLEQYRENPKDFLALDGLHFHALFQSSFQGLCLLLEHIESNYQELLPQIKWLNLGGGHNFTDASYEVKEFVKRIQLFHSRYEHIELIFEPGESVVASCGDFVTTVLDIVEVAGEKMAILDTSTETHLLDVAIVNQRLKVEGTQPESTPYFYTLTGNSCLQGDYIGEYFFLKPLKIGSRVRFKDMMGYSMVKMTEFNGMEKAKFLIKEKP